MNKERNNLIEALVSDFREWAEENKKHMIEMAMVKHRAWLSSLSDMDLRAHARAVVDTTNLVRDDE